MNGGDDQSQGEYLKVAEVARSLGVQPRSVYVLIDQGKLPATGTPKTALRADGTLRQRRGETRVRRADVEAFVQAARVKPGDIRTVTD